MDRLIQRAVTFGRHQLLPLLLVCAMLLPALPARAAAPAEVSNGGFESGDLRGWTVLTPGWATDGRGAPRGVVNAQSYGVCEAPTNQSGRYHLSGPHNGIAGERGWEVRSSAFLLSGSGWISVKMGGQTASVKVFLTDGTQVGYYRQNRYRNVGYPYLSQGGSWYDMATYVMDLSAYLGREMYVVLCDEAGSGSSPNSLFDDVVTYYDDVPDPTFRVDTVTDGHEPLGSAGTAEIPWVMGYNLLRHYSENDVRNGGFESGDLTDWTPLTEGFDASRAVVSARSYWAQELPYNQSGSYHFNGWNTGIPEEQGWAVRSNAFVLGGSGFISVKMGGNAAVTKVFRADGTPVGAYRNFRFRDVSFPYIAQGGAWCDMATYVIDLSDQLGQTLYIELHDEVITDAWANAFFDEVVTYYETAPETAGRCDTVPDGHQGGESARLTQIPWLLIPKADTGYARQVPNGGFETGDLSGWTVYGSGFPVRNGLPAASAASTYWGEELPFNKSGEYFLNGWELSGNEANTWRVRSAPFRLEGSGWISVKMGGHAAAVRVYRLDGTPVGEFEQSRFRDEDFPYLSWGGSWCDMATYHLDLSPNLGEVLYVELCDDPVRGGWANAFFDDLVTYYPAKPAETGDWVTDGHRANERPRQVRIDSVVGSNNLYSPRNGGFELGDLTGWTVVQADHFYEDDAVVSAEDYGMNAERDRLPYNQSGSFHLSGRDAALEESDIWTLRSSPFTLAGSGYISVKMGGSSAAFQVRTAADGKLIACCQQRRYNDVNFPHISEGGSWWDMATYVMDLSTYLGQELVIELLDEEVDAGWAHAFFDDVIGYYAERPHTKADTVIDGYHVDTERPTKIKIPWIYFDRADDSLGRFPMEPAKLSHISGEKAAQDTLNLRQYFIDRQNLSRDELEGSRLSFRTNHYDAAGNAYYLGDVENLPAKEGVYVVQYRFEQGGRTQTGSFDILSLSGAGSRVLNGGFETGTMAGWTPLTDGFNAEGAVISTESYWGEALPYNQSGSYHLDGWNTGIGETEGWRVRSTDFTLSGSGYISVRMGGHAAAVRVYQQDGTLIGYYRQTRFNDANFPHLAEGGSWADMGTYVMDLSAHIGETLYIELCDDVIDGGWAHAFFDEVVTYYETAPDWESLSDTVKDGGTADAVTILWRLAENLLTASKTRLLQLAPAETVPAAPEEDEALPPEPETAAEAVPDSLPEETSEPTEDAEEPAEERREESEAEPEENPEPGEDA